MKQTINGIIFALFQTCEYNNEDQNQNQPQQDGIQTDGEYWQFPHCLWKIWINQNRLVPDSGLVWKPELMGGHPHHHCSRKKS